MVSVLVADWVWVCIAACGKKKTGTPGSAEAELKAVSEAGEGGFDEAEAEAVAGVNGNALDGSCARAELARDRVSGEEGAELSDDEEEDETSVSVSKCWGELLAERARFLGR